MNSSIEADRMYLYRRIVMLVMARLSGRDFLANSKEFAQNEILKELDEVMLSISGPSTVIDAWWTEEIFNSVITCLKLN